MIIFKEIEARNFMSFGDNPVKITLDRTSTTLITGTNGSGKSSIAEAITFALFGKSFRGINKPDLVNTTNQKGCLVILKFTRNEDNFIVTRGIKPNIFTIQKNGEDLKEDASVKDFQVVLEEILGFDYSDFIKIILVGHANYKPLMQLTLPERRQLVDSMLNVGIYTTMSTINKARVSDWKVKNSEVQVRLESARAVFNSAKDAYMKIKEIGSDRETELLEKIKSEELSLSSIAIPEKLIYSPLNPDAVHTKNSLLEEKNSIMNQIKSIIAMKSQKASLLEELESAKAKRDSIVVPDEIAEPEVRNGLKERIKEIDSKIIVIKERMAEIKAGVKVNSDRINFFKDHENCDVCGQVIAEGHKNSIISQCNESVRSDAKEWKSLEERMETLTSEKERLELDIKNDNDLLSAYRERVNQRSIKLNDFKHASENIGRIEGHLSKIEVPSDDEIKSIGLRIPEIDLKVQELDVLIGQDEELKTTVSNHNNEVNLKLLTKSNISKRIDEYKKELEDHRKRDDGTKFLNDMNATQEKIDSLLEEQASLEAEKKILDAATELLKDSGIKASVVKIYVPVLNDLINQYLEKMGATYKILLDENFNDTIKGRYKDEFSYKSLSQGERARVDLAAMFACRKVASLSTGGDSNLLILDEVGDSSMDYDGIEALFSIINETCSDKNVLLVSHRVEMNEKCRSVIRLAKQNGFTKVI